MFLKKLSYMKMIDFEKLQYKMNVKKCVKVRSYVERKETAVKLNYCKGIFK